MPGTTVTAINNNTNRRIELLGGVLTATNLELLEVTQQAVLNGSSRTYRLRMEYSL